MPKLRTLLLATCLIAPCLSSAYAEVPGNKVKIGVLTDMSGPFADQVGAGSVAAAKLAAEDFAKESGGLAVEIVAADHQNKPDIGSGIARKWFDEDGVAAVVDLPNSGVALSVIGIAHDKHRTALASSSMSSDITGKACQPTTVQWVSDTWAQGKAMAAGLVPAKLNDWYFLTVNYALGQALEADATSALTALGGKVAGSSRDPLGTTDFAGPLLQAQGSGANVLALASTGTDMINAIKQAKEFGLSGQLVPAALFIQLSDVDAIGLEGAKGLQLVTGFYWDRTDGTRVWSKRFAAVMNGRMPTEDHAGVYSATLAYLRAVRDTKTIDGEAVVAQMRAKPIDDVLWGRVTIRPDGRAVHDMYRYVVKSPEQSHAKSDDYTLQATIPGSDAFRPIGAGCALGAPK